MVDRSRFSQPIRPLVVRVLLAVLAGLTLLNFGALLQQHLRAAPPEASVFADRQPPNIAPPAPLVDRPIRCRARTRLEIREIAAPRPRRVARLGPHGPTLRPVLAPQPIDPVARPLPHVARER